MEARLGGAHRDLQRGCDLGHLEVEVIAQHDHRPLIGRQPAEDLVEQIAIGGLRRGVIDRRAIRRYQLHLDRPPPATSQDVDAGARDEAPEPTLEPIRIAKGWQAPPRADEPVLDRVSREIVVPEDQSGSSVQPRDEQAGKHGESVMIASLRSFDEFSLVHDPPDYTVGAAMSLRSDGSRQQRAETFPAIASRPARPAGLAYVPR